jgi:hypothetical protein
MIDLYGFSFLLFNSLWYGFRVLHSYDISRSRKLLLVYLEYFFCQVKVVLL